MTTAICQRTGKIKHTRREALQQARWWRRERFVRMNHYRCTACGTWHIGNDRRPKPRRRR